VGESLLGIDVGFLVFISTDQNVLGRLRQAEILYAFANYFAICDWDVHCDSLAVPFTHYLESQTLRTREHLLRKTVKWH